MKPYQQMPIQECGDPLVPIPLDRFAVEQPHPYLKVGAPYGQKSPYFLRRTVLARLAAAQTCLQHQHPGWRIQIFDAYRPLAVQQYMVDYTFAEVVRDRGLAADQLTEDQQHFLWQQVYQFWAVPSADPAMPPPHSTGAAVDLTLVDAEDQPIDMGSPIDELSERSFPDYFAQPRTGDGFSASRCLQIHQNRQLLQQIMLKQGFRQHSHEWWHFSYGDQVWAWLTRLADPTSEATACYGAADRLV